MVSWKDAAERKESVASDAFVMPSRIGFATAGSPSSSMAFVFAASNALISMYSPGRKSVVPDSSIFTLCSI